MQMESFRATLFRILAFMKVSLKKWPLFLFLMLALSAWSQPYDLETMEWVTLETEYEGLPLFLRHPNYEDIWKFQFEYTQLFCISHELDKVTDNGLPTEAYNESLFDFDSEVIHLFDPNAYGTLFLIETYGGSRHYWFYITPSKALFPKFYELQAKHPDKKLDFDYRPDSNWDFIKNYPFELYKPR